MKGYNYFPKASETFTYTVFPKACTKSFPIKPYSGFSDIVSWGTCSLVDNYEEIRWRDPLPKDDEEVINRKIYFSGIDYNMEYPFFHEVF